MLTVVTGDFKQAGELTKEQADAHEETIKFLEDTLRRAKEQKAVFVQCLMLLPDNAVLDGWSDKAQIRPYIIVGALYDIMARFRDKNIEQR